MSSNYPPGVNESDTPGSRPEDNGERGLISNFYYSLSEEEYSLIEEEELQGLVEKAIQFGIGTGHKQTMLDFAEKRYYQDEYHEDRLSSIARMLYWRIPRNVQILHGANRSKGTEVWEVMAYYGFGSCLSSGATSTLLEAIERCYKKVKKLTEHDEKENQSLETEQKRKAVETRQGVWGPVDEADLGIYYHPKR